MGWMAAALRAGTKEAARTSSPMSATATASVMGPNGLTPKSSDCNSRRNSLVPRASYDQRAPLIVRYRTPLFAREQAIAAAEFTIAG